MGDGNTVGELSWDRHSRGVAVPLTTSQVDVIHSVGAPNMEDRWLIICVGVGGTVSFKIESPEPCSSNRVETDREFG